MEKQMLGEFLGTLILILLGNGVVASVLLRKSKAEGAGWMVITTGWGFAVMAGVFTAVACGAPGHLNPAVTLASAITSGDFSNRWSLLDRAVTGRHRRRRAGMGALRPALERHSRNRSQTRLLLHLARDSQRSGQPPQRNHRHVRPHSRSQRHRLESRRTLGACSRPLALLSRLPGLGHRPQPRRRPRAMPSTPPAIWARASRTPFCPSPAKATQSGATRPFRSSARSSAPPPRRW